MPMKGRDEKRWLKDGGRKLAKSRRAERSSVSSGSSSGDAASSSSGSKVAGTTSGKEDSDSSSSEEEREARRKRKGGMWELVNEMWAYEARPKLLQSRKTVEKMSIAEISHFKAHYEKEEEEKKGGGRAVFGRDRKLKAQRFKEGKDTGTSKPPPPAHSMLRRAWLVRFSFGTLLCLPDPVWYVVVRARDLS